MSGIPLRSSACVPSLRMYVGAGEGSIGHSVILQIVVARNMAAGNNRE